MIDAVLERVDPERLRELVVSLVDIPSATGYERPLADHIAATLDEAGVPGRVQPLDGHQANAYGRLAGTGAGQDLMLYAPIDTLATGWPERDRRRAGGDGDLVTGPGAGNPKGHAACVLHAVEVLASSGVSLRGDLIAAFGAGGMPTNPLAPEPTARTGTGHGVGCAYLLEQGVYPDAAVIAKPGTGVTYEEVGLAWFDVTVEGTHTYVGSRHILPYRNAVVAAGRLAERLDDWCAGYTERHTDGQVAPQGIVSAIGGGWFRTAAFTPGSCRLRVDLRLSPRTTPAEARREFTSAVHGLAGELGVTADVEMVLAIAGTYTDPRSRIIQSTVDGWCAEHRRDHTWPRGLSGATDANILRARGVPTARVGMPKVSGISDFAVGMDTVSIGAMATLTRLLIRVALDVTGAPA